LGGERIHVTAGNQAAQIDERRDVIQMEADGQSPA
jgi:hypothetical protein